MGVSVTMMALGLSIISPALPLFGQSFGVGAALVGSLVSVYAVGRRPVLLVSAAIVAIAAMLAATASSFAQLVVWRLRQGIGSGLFTTAAMAAMADLGGVVHRGRALSLFSGAFLIGSSLGPSVGGAVAVYWGLRAPFVVYGVLALLCLIWVYMQVPETAPARLGSRPALDPDDPGRPFPCMDFALVGIVTFAVFFIRAGGRATILPLYASSRFGMTAADIGAMLSVIAAINMIVLYPTGALSDRFGRKRAIVAGLLVMAVAFVQMAVAPSHLAFLAGAAILGLGSGVGGPAPAAYMADLGPPARTGAALGVYRAIGDLGFLAGPVALGWVADAAGYGSALLAAAGLLVVAVLPFAFFAREHRDRWAMA